MWEAIVQVPSANMAMCNMTFALMGAILSMSLGLQCEILVVEVILKANGL